MSAPVINIASGLFIVYREVGSEMTSRQLRVLTDISAAAMAKRRDRHQGSAAQRGFAALMDRWGTRNYAEYRTIADYVRPWKLSVANSYFVA